MPHGLSKTDAWRQDFLNPDYTRLPQINLKGGNEVIFSKKLKMCNTFKSFSLRIIMLSHTIEAGASMGVKGGSNSVALMLSSDF
jgi:hypothetical protein